MSADDRDHRPPEWARRLLRALLGADGSEAVDGDLAEIFANRVAERGVRYARRRHWRDILSIVVRAMPAWRPRPSPRARPTLRELGYSLRGLIRRPGFTSIAVLTLAAGIGAITTVFSVTSTLLVRPALGVGDDIVIVWGTNRTVGQARDVIAGPTFLDLQRENATLSGLAAFHFNDLTIQRGDSAGVVSALQVTPDFFAVTGIQPVYGRVFEPGDARASGEPVLLSHRMWQQSFGGDPAVVGRMMVSGAVRYQVVGILAPDFRFFDTPDVVTLLRPDQLETEARTYYNYWLVGRLLGGQTVTAAERDLDGVMTRIAAVHATVRGWDVTVEPLRTILAEPIAPAVRLALATAVLVLLISCANVASLILTRNVGRHRELGIRLSLGASRARVFWELLSDTVWLAAASAAGGCAASIMCVAALNRLLPPAIAIGSSAAAIAVPPLAVDRPALAFAVTLSAATVMLCGLVPAWRASRRSSMLPAARGATAGPAERRLRAGLVSLEAGLATVLVVMAALLVQSVARLNAVDPGFRGDHVIAMTIGRVDELSGDARERYYSEVLRRVRDVPGVASAALNDYLLLTNEDDYEGFEIEGRAPLASGGWPREEWRRVSADYFRTLMIPLVRGRALTPDDTARSPSVVVINEAMARKYWPGQDPVGLRIRITAGAYGWSEVVGIVGDVREVGVDQPAKPMMFVPYHRGARPVMALFARIAGDPDRTAPTIQRAVWAVDATRPVFNVRRVDRLVADSLAVRRLAERVATATAALALLMTALGIYGTLSHSVSQRRREIGVRVAVGARRRDVAALVLWQGTLPAAIGLALGLVGALWAASLARGQLYGVTALDPWAYLGASVVLLVAAVAASLAPALGAARVDPVVALNED